jgi:very-short-patch-repair endonuclease
MSLPKNNSLKKTAQNLRRDMTKEERHLWYDFLRTYPLQFKRQVIIGNFIVDFYCHKANLVIELDGSQHYDNNGLTHDAQRTDYLKSLRLVVLRIPNNEIWDNFLGVCEEIDTIVKENSLPHQSANG